MTASAWLLLDTDCISVWHGFTTPMKVKCGATGNYIKLLMSYQYSILRKTFGMTIGVFTFTK